MMLYKLLSGWDRSVYQTEVISLTNIGVIGERIRKLNLPVRALEMRGGRSGVSGLIRLTKWLRDISPSVVQTWMYHADLIGGLAATAGRGIPVIWGIRNSTLDRQTKRSTVLTVKACARLSRWIPTRIICCSEVARKVHEALGYRSDRIVVIPNGFDLDLFKPAPEARASLRAELGLPLSSFLVGLVARFDPQKDHRNFIEAAKSVAARHKQVVFVLCGAGVEWENPELAAWIGAGPKDRFHLLGPRDDMPRVTAALDVAASASSYGEAFPNVLGEAMASGVPCVATDVGDSAFIIGDTGKVVPAKRPNLLAEAFHSIISLAAGERRQLGAKARMRIRENFDLPVIRGRYDALYRAVAGNGISRRAVPI